MPQTLAQALGFLLGLALALWTLVPLWGPAARAQATGPEPIPHTAPDHSAFRADADRPFATLEVDLFDSVNRTRGERHLIALSRDPALDDVARAHSRDMARRGFFSHTTPEGLNPVDRITRGGVAGFTLAAENVGKTDRADPNREILDGWLASTVHRRNLLAPAFNRTGIGIAVGSNGTLYYTQLYTTAPRNADSR